MMKRRKLTDYARLDHILTSALTISIEVAKIETYENFLRDENLNKRDTIIRNIEIIGEAAANISDAVKEKYPEVEWQKMKAARNIIVHEYFGIRLDTIWKIASVKIPTLITQSELMIKDLKRDENP